MKVFLAGASGVVGRLLVPRLVEPGHRVTGTTRSEAKADAVRALGAQPVICDVYDRERTREVVAAALPDVVIHHLTDLPQAIKPKGMKEAYAANDRVRREGTPNLVAAGARRIVAQNVAFIYAPVGSWVKDKAKAELGWQPRWPSWREGLKEALG